MELEEIEMQLYIHFASNLPHSNMMVTRKLVHELLLDKSNHFKFHTKLLACYAWTARNIPPTNK
jgi:hypothetical protein